MAVPKKRTSKAAKGQRRSHDALSAPQLTTVSGKPMPHKLVKAAKLGLIKKV